MRWNSLAAILLTACASAEVAAEADAPVAPITARLCAERGMLLRQLATKYEENPTAIGLTSAGGVMELLTSNNGRTWTLIVSRPDGTACLFAAGEDWEIVQARATEIKN